MTFVHPFMIAGPLLHTEQASQVVDHVMLVPVKLLETRSPLYKHLNIGSGQMQSNK